MDKINVGIIGCGGFTRAVHMPNIQKNSKYSIRATMDTVEDSAKITCEQAGASYWTTDLNRLLSDPDIDLVFIDTRHDSHADISVKAAKAGKHILCEKPMGMNREECMQVAEAVRSAGVKYTVGYNRGMSPFIVKARELLAEVGGKRLIYHRIQAPFPESHWTHDPAVGGGRFIGEGCHIFDLLCELVEASPISVFASGATFLDPEIVKIPDSGIVTITFADQSVGTTLISSAGCASFPKESTEIYCCGRAIHISDFTKMEYLGFENQDRVSVEFDSADKGHLAEIDQLADAILLDEPAPNSLVKAARAAVISYKVNESIATGLPVPISHSDYHF